MIEGEILFRKSLKSISIVYKYAPGLTVVKLIQIGLGAMLAPLSISFTQRIVDTIAGIIQNGNSISGLYLWGGLLLFPCFSVRLAEAF